LVTIAYTANKCHVIYNTYIVVLYHLFVALSDISFQDKAVNLAVRVMTAFKSSEIEAAVKAINIELMDVLMKYIYRGFEFPSDGSSASLLAWHEKVS